MEKDAILYSESRIQQDCVIWYRNTYCLIHHVPRSLIISIPNENKPTHQALGLYAGTSDLFTIHCPKAAPSRLIFVECKTLTGKQSPAQERFENQVKSMGFEYYVIRSLEEFKKIYI